MTEKEIIFELIRYRRILEKQGVEINAEVFDASISAMEKQEKERWHSVAKEGNPKTDKAYTSFLVTVDTGYKKKQLLTLCMEWENTTVRNKPVSRWKWRGALSGYEVVAYRALPEPYTLE